MGRDFKVIKADKLTSPLRTDIFLSKEIKLSRGTIQKMLEKGLFTINGKVLQKGDFIFSGNSIEFSGSIGEKILLPDESLQIPVIYEDKSIIVIDKPAGIPVHPLSFSETGTVANWLIVHYPELENIGFSKLEPGILHRLDIETSGVLLIAKDNETFNLIRKQFKGKKIKKVYLAVVKGLFNREGWLKMPLYHISSKKMAVAKENARVKKSFPAESHFKILNVKNNRSLLEIEITTGVTHQIRAHLAYLGFPVEGDTLYSPESEGDLKRMLLHCRKIGLYHPGEKRFVEYTAEPPEEFGTYLL